MRKGQLTASREWWVHLRDTKRAFWRGERKAAVEEIKDQLQEVASMESTSIPDEQPPPHGSGTAS